MADEPSSSLKIEDNKKFDVITIGNALMDILVKVNDEKFLTLKLDKGTMSLVDSFTIKKIEDNLLGHEMILEPGGASANTLSCLALLGCNVVFCGTVGKDNHGEIYEKKMNEYGVLSKIAKKEGITGRAMTLITPDSQRTFAVHLGVASKIGYEDILEDDIKNSKILYLTAYELIDEHLRKTCLKFMEIAEKHGTKIALDLADPNVIKSNLYDLKYVVEKHVNILFANETEAKAFTGFEGEDAAVEMGKYCEMAVVKIGEKGSVIRTQDKTFRVQGFKANAMDTTGAGDTYAAGILYGIVNNLSVEKSGLLGSYLAAKVVEKIGARLSKSEIGLIEGIFSDIDKKLKQESKISKINITPEIIELGDKKFNVLSQTEKGKAYLVDLNTNWCDCPSFYYNKQECKHLKLVKEYVAKKII